MNAHNRRRVALREAKDKMPMLRDDWIELIDNVKFFVDHYETELKYMRRELDEGREDNLVELGHEVLDINNGFLKEFRVGEAIDIVSRTQESLESIARDIKRSMKDYNEIKKELISVKKLHGKVAKLLKEE